MNHTIDQVKKIVAEAQDLARLAAQNFVAEWTQQTGGNQYGEPLYCGFAWVTIYPDFQHKGNTKLGRAERQLFRQLMAAAGIEPDYTGKAYQIWNPGNWPGQSMDVKERAAQAAEQHLQQHGFKAYAGSRAD